MLTRELLQVQRRKGYLITPRFRNPEKNTDIAKKVLDIYKPMKKKGVIKKEIKEIEEYNNYKVVRGLSALVERNSEFENNYNVEPKKVRRKAFEKGYAVDNDERKQVIKKIGEELELLPVQIEELLWADKEENKILKNTVDLEPKELVKEYNLSLTQTLLFDAIDLEFNVSDNYQEIFRAISFNGLMYEVDKNLKTRVTGPLSIFNKTKKYGTSLAKILPYIVKAENWKIKATIDDSDNSSGKDERKFTIDDDMSDLYPTPNEEPDDIFDSKVEKRFDKRIEKAKEEGEISKDWQVKREPTIIRTGANVMIPDFGLKLNDKEEFYVEIVGFWTPQYLEKKIEKARNLKSEKPIIFAVSEKLNCDKEDFKDTNVDKVFFYSTKVLAEPIIKRMKSVENK